MAVTRASLQVARWLRDGTEADPRTQQALAQKLSERLGRRVPQATVSALARGIHTPRGDIISALHVILGIDVGAWSEFAAPEEVPPAPPSSTPTLPDEAARADREHDAA